MKKHIALLLLTMFAALASAQNSAKKYILLEHFTNTRCGICASKNPAFYQTIGQYPNDIHHLSIHPSVPYSNCVLYQANTTDNMARANVYGIVGTPTLALNGIELTPSTPLLSAATIQANLNKTSPLYLKVTQSGTGNQRTAKIEAHSFGSIPAGNYRLFAVVTEKTLNYAAPNGEAVHHDVLRKLLPNAQGEVFNPAPQGGKVEFTYNFNIAANWTASEIYVLAFVQNIDTKEVLNSGTPFDPVLSDAPEAGDNQRLSIFPNPASDRLVLRLDGEQIRSAEIFSANGQILQRTQELTGNQTELSIATLSPGVYFLKITGERGVYVKKFLKN